MLSLSSGSRRQWRGKRPTVFIVGGGKDGKVPVVVVAVAESFCCAMFEGDDVAQKCSVVAHVGTTVKSGDPSQQNGKSAWE